MSIQVELSELAGAMAKYPFAYLLTTSDQGPPHALAVVPQVDGALLRVIRAGRRTLANAQAHPQVSLVWPPASVDHYSLIVDGRAEAEGETLRIQPTRAVLHRPAARGSAAAEGTCTSDCVRIPLTGSAPTR
ncbi:MAG: hypothetical protein EPN72_10360 [Nevskiaceae bacterium]|nr:MAG: hypothetical protein EPN61_01960 [Burkholderiaceae bacterium]TBR72355.1 MAG: hypothetical protein EPN72_10360 [Nevskiaceae bacterium]